MPATVLFVNTPVYIGGAEISLLALMRHLDRQRFAPMLLTSGDGALAAAARSYGIESLTQTFLWPSRRYPWRYPSSVWDLIKTVRRHNVKLIHTNCARSLPYVRQACSVLHLPYVSHVRDFLRDWFGVKSVRALNGAKFVIANSQAIATACVNAGIENSHIRVIYNPIQLEPFAEARQFDSGAIRQELGLPDKAYVIGIVGQIQEIKGHMEFVEAASIVAAVLPQAHFVVIGDAFTPELQTFKKRLLQKIEDYQLTERIHLSGYRKDVARVMQALDVLTVPSWNEPFGRVVVEGQAAGCPVIATDQGGIPELIQNGTNGILVPAKNGTHLAEAIIKLSSDTKLQESIRLAGLGNSQRYSVQQHVDQIEAIYDSALNNQARMANQ